MAISSLSGVSPTILSQAINRDADNTQQRRVSEQPKADNQDAQPFAQAAMTSSQTNAQEASKRAQAPAQAQDAQNDQQSGDNSQNAVNPTGDGTRGTLIDLLV
jgi:hypothetical protein